MKDLVIWLMMALSVACSATIDKSPDESKELVSDAQAETEYMVFTGRLLNQEHIKDVQKAKCLDGTLLCLGGYFKNKIIIEDLLIGNPINGIIEAVSYQHNYDFVSTDETVLFVISKINNLNSIEMLGTEFYAEEISQIETRHCLKRPLKKYVKHLDRGLSCYNLFGLEVINNPIARSLRYELVNDILSDIEAKMKHEGLLLSVTFEMSDGEEVVNTDEIDKKCDVMILTRIITQGDANIDCDYSELFNLLIYKVSKDEGKKAMGFFKQELTASQLNLKPFDIRYKVVEHVEFSEFQVHYKY